MTSNNILSMVRSAREAAIKNRQAAVAKAAKPFDKEISDYDIVLKQLSLPAIKRRPPAPVKKAGSATSKKATKPAKKAAPGKTKPKAEARPAALKAAPVKALKKAAPKKRTARPAAKRQQHPGGYPADGTILSKLLLLIGGAKRFLSMQEIAEMIKKKEPSQSLQALKKRYGKHMGKFNKGGHIVTHHNKELNRSYYGLPSYMSSGSIIAGHQPVVDAAGKKM